MTLKICEKDKSLKIMRLKDSPSHSGKKQGADLANTFKTIKST